MLLKILKCKACSFLWCSFSQPVMVFFNLLFNVALPGQGNIFVVNTTPYRNLGAQEPLVAWSPFLPTTGPTCCALLGTRKHLLFLQACLPTPQQRGDLLRCCSLHTETLSITASREDKRFTHIKSTAKNAVVLIAWVEGGHLHALPLDTIGSIHGTLSKAEQRATVVTRRVRVRS